MMTVSAGHGGAQMGRQCNFKLAKRVSLVCLSFFVFFCLARTGPNRVVDSVLCNCSSPRLSASPHVPPLPSSHKSHLVTVNY